MIAACRNADTSMPDSTAIFDRVSKFFFVDTTQRIIRDLPYLHLILLLCCFDFVDAQQEDSFNYNMIREVFNTALARQKVKSLKFGEEFICRAFCELEEYGVLRATTRHRNEPLQYRSLSMGVFKFQLQTALTNADLQNLPTDLRQWCEVHMQKWPWTIYFSS